MTGSDPATATAAYLSQLPPAVRRAAEIHTATAHGLWVVAVWISAVRRTAGGSWER